MVDTGITHASLCGQEKSPNSLFNTLNKQMIYLLDVILAVFANPVDE